MLWFNSRTVPLLLCADAPHMWSVRPAHVVRMADTCGAEYSHKSFLCGKLFLLVLSLVVSEGYLLMELDIFL